MYSFKMNAFLFPCIDVVTSNTNYYALYILHFTCRGCYVIINFENPMYVDNK